MAIEHDWVFVSRKSGPLTIVESKSGKFKHQGQLQEETREEYFRPSSGTNSFRACRSWNGSKLEVSWDL